MEIDIDGFRCVYRHPWDTYAYLKSKNVGVQCTLLERDFKVSREMNATNVELLVQLYAYSITSTYMYLRFELPTPSILLYLA